MLVTLIVDASFYDATCAAAYAFYAISQRDKLTYSGRFKQPITDSSHAELAAIANALHIVMPHPLAAGADKVLIQTDSKNAIKWLEERQCKHHPAVLAHILGLIDKWGIVAEFRHIKAHCGTAEPRFYCHNWCDKEARRLAKKAHIERLEGNLDIGNVFAAAFQMPRHRHKKVKKVGKSAKDKA